MDREGHPHNGSAIASEEAGHARHRRPFSSQCRDGNVKVRRVRHNLPSTYFESVTGSLEEVLIRLTQSATSPLASRQ